jgi:hypothetical protein
MAEASVPTRSNHEEKIEMKISKIVALTGVLTLASGTSLAGEPPDFADLDANGDSTVDASEFAKVTEAGVETTFEEVDVDKDGKISEKEYEVIKEPDCE